MRTTDEIFKVINEVVELVEFAAGLDINLEATVSPLRITVRDTRGCCNVVNWIWYADSDGFMDPTRLDEVVPAIQDWLCDNIPYRVKTVHDPKLNGHVKA